MSENENRGRAALWNRAVFAFAAIFVGAVLVGINAQKQPWTGWCALTSLVAWLGMWISQRQLRKLEQSQRQQQFDANARVYPELLLDPPDWQEPSHVPDGTRSRVFEGGTGRLLGEIDDRQLRFLIGWAGRFDHLTKDTLKNDFLLLVEDLEMMEHEGIDPEQFAFLKDILGSRPEVQVHWIPVTGPAVAPAP